MMTPEPPPEPARAVEANAELLPETEAAPPPLPPRPAPGRGGFWTRVPALTRPRIVAAIAVALATDGLQLALGPLGWVGADQILDTVAMLLTMGLLRFHVLLLPTFVVEALPVIDTLPTWTGCVGVVLALRKRAEMGKGGPEPRTTR